MREPTRRDLLKYAAGATLASALPVSAQGGRDWTSMPLVVDLSGPMAFEYGKNRVNQDIVDVWLPHLEQVDEHQAIIVTPGASYLLAPNDYTITGPPYAKKSMPIPAFGAKVYPDPTLATPSTLSDHRAENRCIHLRLPMPNTILPLHPVSAQIDDGTLGALYKYATGLRFLYAHAASEGPLTATPLTTSTTINFDSAFQPAAGETSVYMSIDYSPINRNDPTDTHAGYAFTEVGVLFLNKRLKVIFGSYTQTGQNKSLGNPNRPCKAPIIFQG
jgi:hypothetical protein